MSSTQILGDITDRLNQLYKTLESVAKTVSEMSKDNIRSEIEIKLKKTQLKRERLQALALLARSRAVLADTELLIAENELYTEVCDLKRKSPSSKEESKSSKRVKESSKQESKSKKSSEKRPSSNSNKLSKSSHKSQQKSPKLVQENKENLINLPRKGKELIVINNPPFRNDLVVHEAGYISPTLPAQYANKSYSVEHRPTFRNISDIPDMFKFNAGQNLPSSFEGSKSVKRDRLTSKLFHNTNLASTGLKSSEINFNNGGSRMFEKRIADKTNREIELEAPIDNSDYNCEITNGIFDEIMHDKLIIKIEDDDDSVQKLLIDLEGA